MAEVGKQSGVECSSFVCNSARIEMCHDKFSMLTVHLLLLLGITVYKVTDDWSWAMQGPKFDL